MSAIPKPNVSSKRRMRTRARKPKFQSLNRSTGNMMKTVASESRKLTSNAEIRQLILREMAAARERPDFSDAGAEFIECVSNPLGTDTSAPPPMARIPDGSSVGTVVLQETGSYTYAPGTTTSAFIQLVGLCVTNTTLDQSLQITCGANADDATASMTTLATEQFCKQSGSLPYLVNSASNVRVVAAALRIAKNTDDTKQAAQFTGYVGDSFLRYGAASYNTNASILSSTRTSGTPMTAKEGIIVRRSCPTGFDSFHKPNLTIYSDASGGTWFNSHGKMPFIKATSLQDTNYNISWRVVYEVQASPDMTPLEVLAPPMEAELKEIAYLINKMPFITQADSFKSFIKRVWKAGKKVVNFIKDNKDDLIDVAATVAKVL